MLACVLMALGTGLAIWRGMDLERGYHFNRALSGWISDHVGAQELIVGCDNEYLSTTGFLADRRTHTSPRMDLTANLIQFAEARHSRWIILYEPSLRQEHPALLPLLDHGLPDFRMQYEVRDSRGQRIQVFERSGES